MRSYKLGPNLSHRFCQKYLPKELSHIVQGRKVKEGAKDRVLQQEDVSRSGRINGAVLCCKFDIFFIFRIYQEENKCYGRLGCMSDLISEFEISHKMIEHRGVWRSIKDPDKSQLTLYG